MEKSNYARVTVWADLNIWWINRPGELYGEECKYVSEEHLELVLATMGWERSGETERLKWYQRMSFDVCRA